MSIPYSFPLFTRGDGPMGLDTIRKLAPAVFSEGPAPTVSDKYAFIPTYVVLEALLDSGLEIHAVGQHRSRTGNEPYVRHIIRMRQGKAEQVGDVIPEIILVNGHDATARYSLQAGLIRLVCLNGMVVGESVFGGINIIHLGAHETTEQVLEGSKELIKSFPIVMEHRKRMMQRDLTDKERYTFAQDALNLRYPGGGLPPLDTGDILSTHRKEDEGKDLWRTFNVLQENLTNRRHNVTGVMGRSTWVNPVQQVAANMRLNKGLWDRAEAFLEAA
jgi:hypothetical protein